MSSNFPTNESNDLASFARDLDRMMTAPCPPMVPHAIGKAAAVEKQPQNNITLPAPGLYFTLATALAFAENRTKLTILNDDYAVMEADPTPYIKKIMSSFSSPLAAEPETRALKPEEKPLWVKYQSDHLDKVTKILTREDTAHELSAWLLFDTLIKAHKLGVKNAKSTLSSLPTCSAHLESICHAIRSYGVVRFDLLRHERIEELVGDTMGMVKRKLQNFMTNLHKQRRDCENAARAKAAGVEYDAVLGTSRKRKAADVDESEQGEAGEGSEGNAVMSKRVKKAAKKTTATKSTPTTAGAGAGAGEVSSGDESSQSFSTNDQSFSTNDQSFTMNNQSFTTTDQPFPTTDLPGTTTDATQSTDLMTSVDGASFGDWAAAEIASSAAAVAAAYPTTDQSSSTNDQSVPTIDLQDSTGDEAQNTDLLDSEGGAFTGNWEMSQQNYDYLTEFLRSYG